MSLLDSAHPLAEAFQRIWLLQELSAWIPALCLTAWCTCSGLGVSNVYEHSTL